MTLAGTLGLRASGRLELCAAGSVSAGPDARRETATGPTIEAATNDFAASSATHARKYACFIVLPSVTTPCPALNVQLVTRISVVGGLFVSSSANGPFVPLRQTQSSFTSK